MATQTKTSYQWKRSDPVTYGSRANRWELDIFRFVNFAERMLHGDERADELEAKIERRLDAHLPFVVPIGDVGQHKLIIEREVDCCPDFDFLQTGDYDTSVTLERGGFIYCGFPRFREVSIAKFHNGRFVEGIMVPEGIPTEMKSGPQHVEGIPATDLDGFLSLHDAYVLERLEDRKAPRLFGQYLPQFFANSNLPQDRLDALRELVDKVK